MTAASTTLDFTFRVVESIAFSLHAILGITEPCTGCLKGAFRDDGNMVNWGWPVAGCLLAVCAYSNFAFADNTAVILAVQWYIVTFHFGAFWYHVRLGHHPAVGLAPGIFIPIALTIIGIRLEVGAWFIIPLGTIACAVLAKILCRLLVKPPTSSTDDETDGLTREQRLLNSDSH
ncbi:MAG: hypothetical protein SGILL_005159 [Bacillariaceae sp.]